MKAVTLAVLALLVLDGSASAHHSFAEFDNNKVSVVRGTIVTFTFPAIPYTLTGKKMEVPVRRILMGVAPDKAANPSAMADPTALDFFIHYRARQQDYAL